MQATGDCGKLPGIWPAYLTAVRREGVEMPLCRRHGSEDGESV